MHLRRPFSVCLSLIAFAIALPASSKPASAADRPNILLLYVDDMGWGSIGPNGQAARREAGLPWVQTPNLDRLAAEGVNFRRGYGCTVCSPARSSQQTGFHQGHTFADRNDPDNAKKAIRADDVTMGDVLSRAGYTTGYWGKWGYGGSKEQDSPTLDNLQTLPTSHGYQHVVAELHHVRAHTFFQPTLWTAPASKGAKGGLELKPNTLVPFRGDERYPVTPSRHDHADYPDVAYCDDVYAFAALDFVRENALRYDETGEPFFALFAPQIPHAPFREIVKLPEWDAAYRDQPWFADLPEQAQQWCAMVTRIDAHFGHLLDALEDPNGDGDTSDSVAANTLVVFQSDNGGPKGANREALFANGGLSGSKGSIQEGGIRVPTLMRWPARITGDSELRAGSSTDLIIDCTDLLPTFCELAGAPVPLGLDGVSLAPTLLGEGVQRQREHLIHEAGNQASIIRGKYKLVRTRGGGEGRKTKEKGKPSARQAAQPRLYDLEADPAETQDLAADEPERVAELDAILTAERVDEPAGFAVTYHEWTGPNGQGPAEVSNAELWSDYVYENAGITYTTDDGPPRASWIARMAKGGSAAASQDVAFLALEVGGGAQSQELTAGPGVTLSTRNGFRIAGNGAVELRGGAIATERWVEVAHGGRLASPGTIAGDLYNEGFLDLAPFFPLEVQGEAVLGGELRLHLRDKDREIEAGQPIPVLTADALIGEFENGTVKLGDLTFAIEYRETEVVVVRTSP